MTAKHPLQATIRLFRWAVAAGVLGFAMLLGAVATASLRFGRCGPSTLDAASFDCRAGATLLLAAYGVLAVALVLGAVSLSLLWRVRRRVRDARRTG